MIWSCACRIGKVAFCVEIRIFFASAIIALYSNSSNKLGMKTRPEYSTLHVAIVAFTLRPQAAPPPRYIPRLLGTSGFTTEYPIHQ